MEKVLEFVPMVIVMSYILFVGFLFLFKDFRNILFESHKEVGDSSKYSWTRVMGTLIISSSIIVIFYQMLSGAELSYGLITSMISISMGGKVAQKRVEQGKSLFGMFKKEDSVVTG